MADQLCIEYHHYRGGVQDVFILGANGQGVAFDSQYINAVVDILTGFIKASIPEGRVLYMTISDKGVRCEEGLQHG